MPLTTRLRTLEANLIPSDSVPALRVVLVDADGRWWGHDREVDPADVDPRTRVVLLRHLATEEPGCA